MSLVRKRKYQLDWAVHEAVIRKLYLEEDNSLKSIMKVMLEQHSFDASKSQYETQFKKWRFPKNMKRGDWEYIYRKIHERKRIGLDSVVMFYCKLIPEQKLEKELARNIVPSQKFKFDVETLPECPEGISVMTPAPLEFDGFRIDNLPWHSFQEAIKSLSNTTHYRSLANIEFLDYDYHPPSPSLPSYGLGLEDEIQDTWWIDPFNAIYGYQSAVSVNRATRPYDFRPLKEMYNRLSYPEEPTPFLPAQISSNLDHQSSLEQHLINCIIFRVSNNLHLSGDIHGEKKIWEWIIDHLSNTLLDTLISSKLPTAEAFLEQVLRRSLLSGNIGLARKLLYEKHELRQMLAAKERGNRDLVKNLMAIGNLEVIRLVLEVKKNYLHESPPKMPLSGARNRAVAKLLLDYGIGVNIQCQLLISGAGSIYSRHGTPLSSAALYGRIDVMEVLLENNADVNLPSTVDKNGSEYFLLTPLAAALHYKNVNDPDYDVKVLNDMMELLIRAGADVNAITSTANTDGGRHDCFLTPLQFAVQHSSLGMVDLLLNAGAHPNLTHHLCNATALDRSVKVENIGMAKILLAKGASPTSESLRIAVRCNQIKMAQVLLQAGASLSHETLMTAIFGKQIEMVQILLQAGGSLSHRALMAAVESEQIEMVQILLQAGGSLSHRALMAAVESEQIEMVQLLLAAGADFNTTVTNRFGLSIMETALASGTESLVAILLRKAGVNEPSHLGQSTLIGQLRYLISRHNINGVRRILRSSIFIKPTAEWSGIFADAISHGNADIIRIFVEAGVDVNTKVLGYTPLYYAMEQIFFLGYRSPSYFELTRLLLEKGANPNLIPTGVLTRAIECGFLNTAELLLQHGALVNSLGSYMETPLQSAICNADRFDCWDLVETLLKKGADVNAPPNQSTVRTPFTGGTALQLAASLDKEHQHFVERLIILGANVNAPAATRYGMTALQGAVEKGHIEIVKLLLKNGANVNAPPAEVEGFTALQAAAMEGHIEIVYLLLKHGADVNAPVSLGSLGRTALEGAAEWGRLDIVQLLINQGADTHLPGSQRYRVAEEYARKKKYLVVAKLLRSHFE